MLSFVQESLRINSRDDLLMIVSPNHEGDPSLNAINYPGKYYLPSLFIKLDHSGLRPVIMRPVAYVYILTNKHHNVLYVGMTTDLRTRLWEHQTSQNPKSFSARYHVFTPVYYEAYYTEEDALLREKYLKGKTRKWKEALINSKNPEWLDLTNEILNMEA